MNPLRYSYGGTTAQNTAPGSLGIGAGQMHALGVVPPATGIFIATLYARSFTATLPHRVFTATLNWRSFTSELPRRD